MRDYRTDGCEDDERVLIVQVTITTYTYCKPMFVRESEGVSRRMIRTGWLSFVERQVCERVAKVFSVAR